MLFREIIGQEEVKQKLRLAVREGRVPHAQLFTGMSGIGKLQLALAYAQYLNCPHRTDEDSCGTCPTCMQYQHLQHPDLHFVFPLPGAGDACDSYLESWREILLDRRYFDLEDWYQAIGAENKQGIIPQSEAQEIIRKLSLKAYGEGYKVVVIWQPEKMNSIAANKLLKLLEEPPAETVFLLVSDTPEQLLTTILSRVQTIPVPRLEEETIAAGLEKEGVEAGQARTIARIANGSYLSARKKAEAQETEQQELADFKALFRDAYTIGVLTDPHKKYESLKRLRQWSLEMSGIGREKQKHFLQYAQQQVRENYIRNMGEEALNYQMDAERAFSDKFAPFIHSGNVEQIMNQLDLAERQIEQNGNAKMIFFDLCLQMIVLIKKKKI